VVKQKLVVALLLVPALLLADSPGRLKLGYQRWSAADRGTARR
jgi:hypothetical protein